MPRTSTERSLQVLREILEQKLPKKLCKALSKGQYHRLLHMCYAYRTDLAHELGARLEALRQDQLYDQRKAS